MNEESVADILLVEDSPADVELTVRALKKANLANPILVINDGVAALDYAFRRGEYADRGSSSPKVILLAIKLPKVDGIEVLRRLKSDDATKLIPVVMLTSSREERDVVESYRLGANSYIVKPVDFEKFVEAVEHIGLYWLLLNEPPV